MLSREVLSFLMCALGSLISMLFCFNWGFTLFDVVDHYLSIYLLLFVGVLECFAVGWVHGIAETIERVNFTSVAILGGGFWVTLLIMGPLLSVFDDKFWQGCFAFWVLQLLFAHASYRHSRLPFHEWFEEVYFYGVRSLAIKLTNLNKPEPGACWVKPF